MSEFKIYPDDELMKLANDHADEAARRRRKDRRADRFWNSITAALKVLAFALLALMAALAAELGWMVKSLSYALEVSMALGILYQSLKLLRHMEGVERRG